MCHSTQIYAGISPVTEEGILFDPKRDIGPFSESIEKDHKQNELFIMGTLRDMERINTGREGGM